MPRDYYAVLGVSRQATADQIRKSFRDLARKFHPDVSDSEDAARRFAEITEAYEVLSDEEKRKKYDTFGHAGVRGNGPGAWAPSGAGPGGVDIGSIFEEMFARPGSPFGAAGGPRGASGFGQGFGQGFGPGPQPQAPRRGANLDHKVTVSFLTAARGGTEQVRLEADSGEQRTIEVRIPAGVESGAKLRVKGEGRRGVGAAPAGDIIITVEVGRHPVFRRDGLDLSVDIPVTIVEAAFGTSVSVPLLDGTADVRIPPASSSGRRLRLKGKGIVTKKATGDLLAVVQIAAPEPMNEKVKTLIEQLADELQCPRDSGPWAEPNGAD